MYGSFPHSTNDPPSREARDINSPEIIISALHFDWETVAEAFDRCVEAFSAHGIEFAYPHPRFGQGQFDLARSLAEQTGLRIHGHFWGNLALRNPADATERLLGWLDVATSCGFSQIIVQGGARRDRHKGREIVIRGIKDAIGEFEQSGVTLGIQNHYPYSYQRRWEIFNSPDEFAALHEAVDSPALGFVIDYGHGQMGLNTAELVEVMGPRLVNAHVSDNSGVHDDHLPFGEGVVLWKRVLRKTYETGFRGPFTLEFPLDNQQASLAECRRMIETLHGR